LSSQHATDKIRTFYCDCGKLAPSGPIRYAREPVGSHCSGRHLLQWQTVGPTWGVG